MNELVNQTYTSYIPFLISFEHLQHNITYSHRLYKINSCKIPSLRLETIQTNQTSEAQSKQYHPSSTPTPPHYPYTTNQGLHDRCPASLARFIPGRVISYYQLLALIRYLCIHDLNTNWFSLSLEYSVLHIYYV